MNIKVFCRPTLSPEEWEIYVTDDDFDTYSLKITSKEVPSIEEMKRYWLHKKGDFQLHSYTS